MDGNFTIPKKIPKKNRDASAPAPSLLPPGVAPPAGASQPSAAAQPQQQPMKRSHSTGSSHARDHSPPSSSTLQSIKSPDHVKKADRDIPSSKPSSSTRPPRRKSSQSASSQPPSPSEDNPSPGGGVRSSGRVTKKKQSIYTQELEDTDTDDLMTSGEEEVFEKRRMKRIAKKKQKKAESSSSKDEAEEDEEEAKFDEVGGDGNFALLNQGDIPGSIYDIEGPPPGELSCLWYSREPFQHVFVIEKILAWKTRPVTKLESMEEEVLDEKNAILAAAEAAILGKKEKPSYALGFEEALKLKDKAIFDTGNDFRKRMDISRINPGSCPVVRKLASQQEVIKSKKDGSSLRYKAVTSNTDREEVFLIKWRGRSYMHCSWERKRDLEKFDHSTQLGSARGKINRYIQSQVIALGDDWKLVLEEGRQAASTPAGHHGHYSHTPAAEGKSGEAKPGDDDNEGSNDSDKDEEEYFSPLHLEVDRILGCDENELDMNVLARQRALNLRAEKEALRKRELEDEEEEKWLKGESPEAADAMKVDGENVNAFADIEQMEKDGTWDPEDNVRYIVRWKGLQLTEATWEYWIDIKRDFVDEVEDFWRRQQAPSDKLVKEISGAPHPHPRSFRKLTESPVFGVSTADRPIAKLNDGQDGEIDAISDSDTGSVLKLRAYQLEGVNWLLWNWYNRRSCILADEMGLG